MSKWDRKKLKMPQSLIIPTINRPKTEQEGIDQIERILTKMLKHIKKTQLQDIIYRYKGVIYPVKSGAGVDEGSLPYGNLGAVKRNNKAECLFSMLSRGFIQWWEYVMGKDENIPVYKSIFDNIEKILDNFDDYETKYTDALGYRLCKKGGR